MSAPESQRHLILVPLIHKSVVGRLSSLVSIPQHIIVVIQLKALFQPGMGLATSVPVRSFPASLLSRIVGAVAEAAVGMVEEVGILVHIRTAVPVEAVELRGTEVGNLVDSIQAGQSRLVGCIHALGHHHRRDHASFHLYFL